MFATDTTPYSWGLLGQGSYSSGYIYARTPQLLSGAAVHRLSGLSIPTVISYLHLWALAHFPHPPPVTTFYLDIYLWFAHLLRITPHPTPLPMIALRRVPPLCCAFPPSTRTTFPTTTRTFPSTTLPRSPTCRHRFLTARRRLCGLPHLHIYMPSFNLRYLLRRTFSTVDLHSTTTTRFLRRAFTYRSPVPHVAHLPMHFSPRDTGFHFMPEDTPPTSVTSPYAPRHTVAFVTRTTTPGFRADCGILALYMTFSPANCFIITCSLWIPVLAPACTHYTFLQVTVPTTT